MFDPLSLELLNFKVRSKHQILKLFDSQPNNKFRSNGFQIDGCWKITNMYEYPQVLFKRIIESYFKEIYMLYIKIKWENYSNIVLSFEDLELFLKKIYYISKTNKKVINYFWG